MTDVLLLGATGRTGSFLLNHRPAGILLHAGVRPGDATRPLPVPEHADDARAIDIDDPTRMREALTGIDIVVNTIRLREEIAATALIDLHDRIGDAQDESKTPLIVHVGGAGALHMGNGRRFWQDPAFPTVTLPRGVAHAALRDHLESETAPHRWAYLIPPPSYQPEGQFTGSFRRRPPAADERTFLQSSISYEDFALALADAIRDAWTGTHLISA